jgi:hypothetical protein
MKLAALVFAALASGPTSRALPAERINNEVFYATRKHQLFKMEDVRASTIGYMRGDDVPYLTWNGFLSGKDAYFELHGDQIKLRIGKRITAFTVNTATALPGGDTANKKIDPDSATLFVKSTNNPAQSMICIESLGPDIYRRPRPYWEVYLLTDPITKPRLYRLSGINASCKGIERLSSGKLGVPSWKVSSETSPNVVISYYAIEPAGYRLTDIRFTGNIVSDDAQEYVITEAK